MSKAKPTMEKSIKYEFYKKYNKWRMREIDTDDYFVYAEFDEFHIINGIVYGDDFIRYLERAIMEKTENFKFIQNEFAKDYNKKI